MCKSWKNVSSHWTEIYCYLWKEMHSTYSENKPKYFNTSNVKDLCELFDTLVVFNKMGYNSKNDPNIYF